MQALYDLALAMTTDRSLEENLLLVVEKSRELLGADKSFIAMRDETAGDLYMHTLSGVVTRSSSSCGYPSAPDSAAKSQKQVRGTSSRTISKRWGRYCTVVGGEGLISGIVVPVQIRETKPGRALCL